jgi:hypothetical protein
VQKFAIGAKIRQILIWKPKSLSLFPDSFSPGDITADSKFTLENFPSNDLARPFSRA